MMRHELRGAWVEIVMSGSSFIKFADNRSGRPERHEQRVSIR
jgi:hypothetical protein